MAQATHQATQQISLVAAADLSAKQYYFADVDSNGKAALAGAGNDFIGVIGNKPTSGAAAEIIISGICPVVAGGTVAAGDAVKIDSDGKDRKSTRLNSSHSQQSRMPSSA